MAGLRRPGDVPTLSISRRASPSARPPSSRPLSGALAFVCVWGCALRAARLPGLVAQAGGALGYS
eukprot:scaffold8032_cov136-Isochrysis_galbana.AAC.3